MTHILLTIAESRRYPGHCSVNVEARDNRFDPPTEAEIATTARFQAAVNRLMEEMLRELTEAGFTRAGIIGTTPPEESP